MESMQLFNHILGHYLQVVLIWWDTFCKQQLFCLLVTSYHYLKY